jgi:NADPH-ferrihemoprotein reductase
LGNEHISPLSFQSPVGIGPAWTPATTISPSYVVLTPWPNRRVAADILSRIPVKNAGVRRALNGAHPFGAHPSATGENASANPRGRVVAAAPNALPEKSAVISPTKPAVTVSIATPQTPTKKAIALRKSSSVSPAASRKNVEKFSPKSAAA